MNRRRNRVVCRVRAGFAAALLATLAILASPATPAMTWGMSASGASGAFLAPTEATKAPPATATASEPGRTPAPAGYPEKSGVILELIPFVEWPTSPTTNPPREFVIGVLGDDRFAEAIRAEARGRKVKELPIRVRSFRNLDEVDPCPILVIGTDKARLLPVILDFLGEKSGILTVGDRAEFAAQGGIVELVELPGRVGFEINRDAAGRSGLRLGAQLLRLAESLLPADDSGTPGR